VAYVLFFIELDCRDEHVAGRTPNPSAPWVIQQARQLSWTLAGRSEPMRFLIRDRDQKFTDPRSLVMVTIVTLLSGITHPTV